MVELKSSERDRLLALLGCEQVLPDEAGLRQLQRAWLLHQPFHNLDLLAARSSGRGTLTPEEGLSRCLSLLGGPCHVQALGFCALLRSIGIHATLCGAQISRPSDHLLVRTMLGAKVWLSDVGNGQPYLEPFPAVGYHAQAHLGWEIRTTGDSDSVVLERRSPDQPAWKRVYVANTSPRTWQAFAGAIHQHHSDPGFGPFLTGLRAVRIGASEMITVRNEVVTVYHAQDYDRSTWDIDSIHGLLANRMGLGSLPVAGALAAWQRANGMQ